jgi:hypothetical protein
MSIPPLAVAALQQIVVTERRARARGSQTRTTAQSRLPVRSGLKSILTLALIPAFTLHAADTPKPKVRAITGFVSIDAKSYPAQLEDATKFLSHERDALKAAGYDVAGIRGDSAPPLH